MGEALKQAQIALEEGEIPVGAVVVCKGRVIARAYNQVEKLQDATAHAEMLAISAASEALGSKYLDQCALYVTLEPCTMCGGALNWSQLQKVVYAVSDEKRGCLRHDKTVLHPKTEIITGVKTVEATKILNDFFEELRSK